MYTSNSFIQESIYESQTQNIVKVTPPPINSMKDTKKEPFAVSKMNNNDFLKIYE